MKNKTPKYNLVIVEKKTNTKEKFKNKPNIFNSIYMQQFQKGNDLEVSLLLGVDTHNVILENEQFKLLYNVECNKNHIHDTLSEFYKVNLIGER